MKLFYEWPANWRLLMRRNFALLGLFLCLNQSSFAQCLCDATVDVAISNAWPNYVAGQSVCLTGTGAFPVNGTKPDHVCIQNGSAVNVLNGLNGTGWDISVAGTLTYQTQNLPESSVITIKNGGAFLQNQPDMGANGQNTDESKLIIESGGEAQIAATSIGNLVTLQNAGNVEFTTDAKIDFKGVLSNTNQITTSTNNNNAILSINPGRTGAAISNSGTIKVAHFESHVDVPGGTFTNSGSITVEGIFFTHGRMTTTATGSVNTTCGTALSSLPSSFPNMPPNTSFYVGDKEAGSFINSGVYNICGNAMVSGLVTLSSGSIFISGDLTLTKGITGSDGKLQVDGVATASNGEGIYSGSNFLFYSPGDNGIINYPPNGSNYTVSSSPLPVKLLDFQAKYLEGSVLLSWSTTEEANSSLFEVERSSDMKTWVGIGNLNAAGNSSVTKFYSFTDTRFFINAINYYRLKMMDADGSYTYSTIRSASAKTSLKIAFIYPNPTKGYIRVNDPNWAKASQVFIYDMLGKVVLVKGVNDITDSEVDIRKLSAGTYHLRVVYENGMKATHSFLVTD